MRLLTAIIAATLSITGFAAAPSVAAELRVWLEKPPTLGGRGEAVKTVSYVPPAAAVSRTPWTAVRPE